MSYTGKVALITGASRGIGKELALTLAKNGIHVVVAAKTTEAHPDLPGTIFDTANECSALGPEALAIKMNVRNEEEVKAGVEATIEKFGRIDYAIHNAGALWWKPIADTPVNKFDLVMDVNVRGAYALAYYTLPYLKKNGGHFMVMSPPVEVDMLGGKVGYGISKFGMSMVALGLSQEHSQDNIAANSLWPETAIETAATINFGLGDKSMWYKANMVSDAAWEILKQDPSQAPNGQSLLVMDVLKNAGISDFTPYRSDPESEPPILNVSMLPRAGGKEKAFA